MHFPLFLLIRCVAPCSVASDAELTAARARLTNQAMGVRRGRVRLGVYWTYPVIGGGIFSARILKLLNEAS